MGGRAGIRVGMCRKFAERRTMLYLRTLYGMSCKRVSAFTNTVLAAHQIASAPEPVEQRM